MTTFRRLVRKIRSRPLGKIKRASQSAAYLIISFLGNFIIFCLSRLGLIKSREEFSREKLKNILIVRPDGIGDVVLATPLLKVLRENFPRSHIAVLLDKKTQDLIAGNPYIDEIFTIKHKGITGLFRNRELISKLAERHFDLAIVLYPTLWCNILALICGIPHRLGHGFHGNGFLLTIKPSQKYEELNKHEVESNLDLLRLIGVESTGVEFWVGTLGDSEIKIEDFLSINRINSQDKLIVIHPGANEECDRWSEKGFTRVADELINNYNAKVVILGGPGEEKLVNEITSSMLRKPVVAVGLTLSEVISLIKKAELFIGNSTGPMHIASALTVPVVAIFGNIHPLDSYQNWAPYGTDSVIVHKDIGCIDCQPADCKRYKCLEVIKAEDVILAAIKLLKDK